MLLRQLVQSLEEYQLLGGSLDVEISKITDHSAKVLPQSMFVCVSGYRFDGHEYVTEAIKQGAVCIVTEKQLEVSNELTLILVPDTRKAVAALSAAFYRNPASRLCLIGITGTKGKTTCANMVRRILTASGKNTGIIGTLGAECDGFYEEIKNTTPDALTLHHLLSEMENRGCTHVVLEVSSQSLMQSRVYGIRFQIAVFTNFYPDHVGPGEHSSLDEYAFWKSTLFKNAEISVLNMGTDRFLEMVAAVEGKFVGYYLDCLADETDSLKNDKEFRCPIYPRPPELIGVSDSEINAGKMTLFGRYTGEFHVGLPGRYNLENALGALAVASLLNIPLSDCTVLSDILVPGRTEMLDGNDYGGDYRVVIDYAHNESGMENLLIALSEMKPKRLICVYGSGGDRSVMRRLGMGRVGGRICDLSVLTEDNSRSEPLSQIIAGLIEGVESVGGKYVVIPDRREAIHTTIMDAQPDDLIAIIGKGHENYQEIGSCRYPFSDRDEARQAMRMRAELVSQEEGVGDVPADGRMEWKT